MIQLELHAFVSIAHQLQHLPAGHPCGGIHGHEMEVWITVTGERDERGLIIPFETVRDIWTEHARVKIDHCLLNKTITNPTAENLAEWLAKQLAAPYADAGVQLASIKVQERLQTGERAAAIWTPWCEEWTAEAIGPGAQ